MKKKIKVLITAGSTWIGIDSVRVMTNIFGGKLGIEICREALRNNFNVTMLLGNSRGDISDPIFKMAKIVHFKYFDELLKLVKIEIEKNKYDVVIHSAAISDYQLKNKHNGKIKSGKDNLVLEFVPTLKIVDIYKKIDPKIFLVMFKLEVNKSKHDLINIAMSSMNRAMADVIVANDFNDLKKHHKAYILQRNGNLINCIGKKDIAKKIVNCINDFKNNGKQNKK